MNAFPTTVQLPEGVRVIDGRLYRRVTVTEDGEERYVRRPVALTLEEAKKSNSDYHHPEFGWIRGGKKMEREHPLVTAAVLKAAGGDAWPEEIDADGAQEVPLDAIARPESSPAFQSFLPSQPAPSYDAGEY